MRCTGHGQEECWKVTVKERSIPHCHGGKKYTSRWEGAVLVGNSGGQMTTVKGERQRDMS